MKDDALTKRLTGYLDRSEKIVRNEGLQGRVNFLARAYGTRMKTEDWQWGFAGKDTIIHVNKVNPITRQGVAALHGKRPDIVVRPRLPEFEDGAKKNELALNYIARRHDDAEEINLVVTAALLFPYGVLKLGFNEARDALPSITWTPTTSFRADPTMEHFDPEHGKWCAFKYKRTIQDLRASGLYEEADVDALAEKVMSRQGGEFEEGWSEVWLWEHYVWEIVENKKIIMRATTVQDVEGVMASREFTRAIGLPCRVLVFNRSFMPEEYFPVSPVELWIEQQKELNALRSNQLIHSDRAQRKLIYNSRLIEPAEAEKFESVEPLVAIAATGAPADAARYVEIANLSADIYHAESRVVGDIENISAVSNPDQGAPQETGSVSATRDAMAENAYRMRLSDRQDIFERFLERVYGGGMLPLMQERLPKDLQIKISDGLWSTYTRAEIQGRYDVLVSVGSTLPSDRPAEWERAKERYELLQANPLVNQKELLMNLLGADDRITDKTKWINAPAMPPPGGPPGPPGAPGTPPMPPGGAPGPNSNGLPPGMIDALMKGGTLPQAGPTQSPLSFAHTIRAGPPPPPGRAP